MMTHHNIDALLPYIKLYSLEEYLWANKLHQDSPRRSKQWSTAVTGFVSNNSDV